MCRRAKDSARVEPKATGARGESLAPTRAFILLLSGDDARALRTLPRRMHVILRRRLAFGAVALLSSVASLASCSRGGQGGKEIGIGVALDPKRAGMQSIYNGVELAVTQLNGQRNGGPPLRMIKGDPNVSDPIRIADSLRSDPAVVGVVGHPESGTTLDAIGEYADTKNLGRNAVVAISPTGTSPALSGASKWLFRVCPSDVQTSRTVARYVLDSLRASRATVRLVCTSLGQTRKSHLLAPESAGLVPVGEIATTRMERTGRSRSLMHIARGAAPWWSAIRTSPA